MAQKTTLAAAGNVLVPAYLALIQKGYAVRSENTGAGNEVWFAENDTHRFIADDPVTLVGLVALHETRGDDWQAPDEEIMNFLARYPTQ
jgi:hypothetical protein